ncbi:FCD domain protein [Caballeronia pedi]|uniref:FCD domain protein n=1 Tax=Caballeronia pedi TaxID=1777141 RepID=A0A158E5L2_9BURK|nr:GntR family transcriptional regulator [Caballeronia pedi]SAL01726.1 FCD domain protein [Caballeronia pedi]
MSETVNVNGIALSAEDEAYRFIEAAIRSGRYRAGERLVGEDIAAEIGTSRMPVREAFRRLSAEGLLRIRPNRGVIVRGLNAAEMREVFEMRAALEGLAAGLAVPKITRPNLATLEHLLDQMEQANADFPAWVTYHREFHEYLTGLAGMPRLTRQLSGLHSAIEPYMRIWLEHADKPMTSRDDHSGILQAIKTGNERLVEETVREHVRATIPALVDFVML